jgi:hypothetical protein
MFDYAELISKAKLYFGRAERSRDADEKAIWQILGLEFLLRAPLARVSPSLLALPEGDSILHSVGVPVPLSKVSSVPFRTVVDRVQKVIPEFGGDRASGALRVAGIRNAELHSSHAAVAAAARQDWLPALLDCAEAVCLHLAVPLEDIMPESQIVEATEYRVTARNETQGLVSQAIKLSKQVFGALKESEVDARLAAVPKYSFPIQCPACSKDSLVRKFGTLRTERAEYDELKGDIKYETTRVVVSGACAVCGLSLNSTAEILAAGLDRLVRSESTESRYDGWEEVVTESEINELIEARSGWALAEDYGND